MKQVERYFYPAVFSYAPDQEIAVTFPDLDVATSGTDDTDALLSARELLGCVLCGLEEDGEDMARPPPSGRCKAGGRRTGRPCGCVYALRPLGTGQPQRQPHRHPPRLA